MTATPVLPMYFLLWNPFDSRTRASLPTSPITKPLVDVPTLIPLEHVVLAVHDPHGENCKTT